MMKTLSLVLFIFVTNIALGQVKAYKDMGDKAYKSKDYYTAAYYYDKAMQEKSTSSAGTAVPYFSSRLTKKQQEQQMGQLSYRLAESYRLYHNYVQAEGWYKQVTEKYEQTYPLARFWYAVCLRSNNHYDEAITQLQAFIKASTANTEFIKLAEKELQDAMFAKQQLAHPELIKVVKMAGHLNADAGDFGISINNNQFYFTSSRTTTASSKHINQIYVRNKDNSSYVTKVDFELGLKPGLQYSTPSLDTTGKLMYLTIWHADGNKPAIAIYLSRYANKKWSTPQKLNTEVNADGYNSMQPFVTGDGKHLYYASNKPGGLGGTDIWMSDLGADGQAVNAVNLGNKINTTEDEQAPFYNPRDHKLVYSTKGLTGMGGFDLFESFNTGTQWDTPRNLGYPFNSTKDDLYYYPDEKDDNAVYLSSDRESECCLNLFKVYYYAPLLTGLVIDCATNKPLRDAKVSLVDSVTKVTIDSMSTTRSAQYSFKLSVKRSYILKLEKPGYFTKNIPIPAITLAKSDTLYNPTVCQQSFQLNKAIVIKNVFYDFNKATLRLESQIVLNDLVAILNDNPKIKVELSSHTDSFGTDVYNMNLSQERAQACVDYIISKGINADRIFAKGYGKTRPIQPNTFPDGRDNPAGRQQNRRTEFKVLSTL
ncbi:OmpA family protein [Mucilaginibacter sp. HMF5004]|uniref:OmpA family protein n=1 Tax=Mucilaginibacter rivuli TaxID=2857527 RepID=UPI001C5D80A7|nr:OmpA family protein [Mucilaginibacter rivuli]MBW4891697.1 OmpA family protein [Mucilaginibacter rivuli]